MARQFLLHILPFLLPFIAYFGAVLLMRHAEAKGQVLSEAPWFWLIASGLVLAIASFVAVALLTGHEPGGTYVPPHLEDGKVVPGHFE